MKKCLTAILMLIVMLASLGTAGAAVTMTFPPHGDTGTDILWLSVPWEDKGRSVWFGVQFNEHRFAFNHASISIDILQKETSAYQALYNRLDQNDWNVLDEEGLMLMDVELRDNQDRLMPADDLNVTMYIAMQEEWDKKLHFSYLASGRDESYRTTIITDPYSGYNGANITGRFLAVTMDHFSPFAAYTTSPKPAAVPPPTSGSGASGVPATGDSAQPALWMALLAASVLMGAAVLAGSKAKAQRRN